MKPPPTLLQRLARSRLLVRSATASVGIGERRSPDKGSGMEFADHREYQPGDDIRHLDPHVYARFERNVVRQYEVHRQLPVTILVDGSRSMEFGAPSKYDTARLLAATLGFIGLAGGDLVQAAVWSGGRLHWSPRFHGVSRAQRLFDWIGGQRPGGTAPFGPALHEAARRVPEHGLLIVLGDFWDDSFEADIRTVAAARQEIWAIQVVAPAEADPAGFGGGEARLVDAESGQEIELALDRMTLDRYRRAFADRRERLREVLGHARGRYRMVLSTEDLDRLVLQDWRRDGMVS